MDSGADSYRRFLDGDENGFTEIVRDYKDGLILYLCGFTENINTAQELTEDTFVKLGIKKPHFSEKSLFKTWLYAIAGNIARDYLRKQRGRKAVSADGCEELADTVSLEADFLREERKILIHRAMKRLKPEYRQALWLFYFEGFSCAETAKIMGKSRHNIETVLYRGRQALKKELLKEGFEYDENI